MSYCMLGGKAVHFQIISRPAEKYMKQDIMRNSMYCMGIVCGSMLNINVYFYRQKEKYYSL